MEYEDEYSGGEEKKVTKERKEITSEQLNIFEHFLKIVKEYGFLKVLCTAIFFVFFSMIIYLAFNPSIIFESYDKYESNKHSELTEYRMESSPLIRNYLNNLADETGADRAYIVEYHNGKSNPSGLQWQYGDMTFINDDAEDVRDEFQNISLVRYPLFYELYENVMWAGTIDELALIDKRFSTRVEVDEVEYIVFSMIYGSNLDDLGFIGVSFKNAEGIDKEDIKRKVQKYTTTISPLLDAKKIKDNIKK